MLTNLVLDTVIYKYDHNKRRKNVFKNSIFRYKRPKRRSRTARVKMWESVTEADRMRSPRPQVIFTLKVRETPFWPLVSKYSRCSRPMAAPASPCSRDMEVVHSCLISPVNYVFYVFKSVKIHNSVNGNQSVLLTVSLSASPIPPSVSSLGKNFGTDPMLDPCQDSR